MRKVQKLSGDLSHTATLTIPWSTYCNLEEPRHGDSCGISLALFKKKKKSVNKHHSEPTRKQTQFYVLGYINGEDERKVPVLVGLSLQLGDS